MAGIPQGIARYLDRLVLAACVLASIWLMSQPQGSKVTRASRWAHLLTTPVEWSTEVLGNMRGLRAENERLRVQLTALELDQRTLVAERAQLEQLAARAGFYERHRGRLAAATVLEIVVSRIPVQAKIKSFGVDSLRAWMPVITEKGLVGRIRHVLGRDMALVQLLTDEDSRISVEASRNGVTGLLRYDGRRFLLDHVPQGDPLQPGDELVTSGLGGTVPQGIPIGTVLEVHAPSTELFQEVVVEPAVRFSAVSQVYVVMRAGPWYWEPPEPPPSPPGTEAGADTVAAEGAP